jgi:hypothetical protein
VLDKEIFADPLENGAPPPSGAPMVSEFARKRLDNVEDCGNCAFVACKNHALGKRIGDGEKPLGRSVDRTST